MRPKGTKLLAAGIGFMLIGVLLLSVPIYEELKYQRELKALEDALTLISMEADPSASGEVMEDALASQHTSLAAGSLDGIMELEIPAIELKQYVLPETTEENLKIALTQLKEDQTPGQGNFTIAGHRGYRNDRHFSNLPEVQNGDDLLLHTGDATYVYQVTSAKVIPPNQVEVLDDLEGKTEITLITCTRDGKKRIAVKGELVDTRPRPPSRSVSLTSS
ncbi:class D sortase [Paenibacillus senegalensis]|uniref:class D sortase n=1 Tax=Paenibacillus senegalensis TaxID=1465766 RepID=UPI0002893702|nr:class D sortase [Paenibacillus senegalensis]